VAPDPRDSSPGLGVLLLDPREALGAWLMAAADRQSLWPPTCARSSPAMSAGFMANMRVARLLRGCSHPPGVSPASQPQCAQVHSCCVSRTTVPRASSEAAGPRCDGPRPPGRRVWPHWQGCPHTFPPRSFPPLRRRRGTIQPYSVHRSQGSHREVGRRSEICTGNRLAVSWHYCLDQHIVLILVNSYVE